MGRLEFGTGGGESAAPDGASDNQNVYEPPGSSAGAGAPPGAAGAAGPSTSIAGTPVAGAPGPSTSIAGTPVAGAPSAALPPAAPLPAVTDKPKRQLAGWITDEAGGKLVTDSRYGRDSDWDGHDLVTGMSPEVRPPAEGAELVQKWRFTSAFGPPQGWGSPGTEHIHCVVEWVLEEAYDRDDGIDVDANTKQRYVSVNDPSCATLPYEIRETLVLRDEQAYGLPPDVEEQQRRFRVRARTHAPTQVRLRDGNGHRTQTWLVMGFHVGCKVDLEHGFIAPCVYVGYSGYQRDLARPPPRECTMPQCVACDLNGDQRMYAYHWRFHCPCFEQYDKFLGIDGLLPYVNLHQLPVVTPSIALELCPEEWFASTQSRLVWYCPPLGAATSGPWTRASSSASGPLPRVIVNEPPGS